MSKKKTHNLPEEFEKYVEFQNRRYDYGGQVPLFEYASRHKVSKKVRRDRQRLGLAFLSIFLFVLSIIMHQFFLYFWLAIAGLWFLYRVRG